ncbi:MAG: GlsB/YeaQ/YmgE family stress response membrane protein [Gammaproteobacteria bacterium]|nr:GlsB/YeaQ/YmgE family stress response membrane protein [Gammaproteobacteria bacterium]
MGIESLFVILLIGALAGWLAGLMIKGSGFGLIGNIVVGILGAVLGSFLFGLLGIASGGFLAAIIMATIGAVILLYAVSVLKKV